jgi:hypothetical protein
MSADDKGQAPDMSADVKGNAANMSADVKVNPAIMSAVDNVNPAKISTNDNVNAANMSSDDKVKAANNSKDEKVRGAKDKLARALSDDEAAWAEYLQAYGGGSVMRLLPRPLSRDLPEPARLAAYTNNFKASLRAMDKLNKEAEARGNDGVAYGITVHAHLSLEDYAALRTTGVLKEEPLEGHKMSRRLAAPPSRACSYSSGRVDWPYASVTSAASVDWVARGLVTPVKDQGHQRLRLLRCFCHRCPE